jgi:hypothetical protein
MNCLSHQNVVAVSACSDCGAGLCADCVNRSEYTVDNKALCRSCNYKLIQNLLKDDRSLKIWTTVKLVINAVCLLLGASIWFSGHPENAVIILAIGGIPTAWKMLSPSAEDRLQNKVHDSLEDAVSPGSSIGNSLFRFIFRLIFTVIVGAIAAPVLLIVSIVKLVKATKRIANNEELLANFGD